MSTPSRRQRDIAAAKAQRREARLQSERKKKDTLRWIVRGAIAAGVLTAFFLTVDVSSWFSSRKGSTTAPAITATPTPTAKPTPSKSAQSWSKAPALSEGTNATSMVLTLNRGIISIALDKKAPATLASMAFLARQKYFDDTRCHRLTTAGIFVLQCGDPTATGTGGPGYTIPDENLPAKAGEMAVYPRGTVAMANAGPNTGGSQFFLVYKDSPLPANYTVWGRMTSGLDVLDRIAADGTASGESDAPPKTAVVITSATTR
ncbi:MAG: hypothetical protein RL745_865 [Actinomycetota bacterium]